MSLRCVSGWLCCPLVVNVRWCNFKCSESRLHGPKNLRTESRSQFTLLMCVSLCVCVCVCVSSAAHQSRVSDMVFSLESEWVVSTGHDKSVSWMCTESGSMLGRHYFTAWASCLQYPLCVCVCVCVSFVLGFSCIFMSSFGVPF